MRPFAVFEMDSFSCGKTNRSSKPSNCSTFMIELDQSSSPSECNRQTIGLLHGNYQQLPQLPQSILKVVGFSKAQPERDITMTQFVSSSEENELAEFRILNYKDRVIVRSVDDDKHIIFGNKRMIDSHHFLGFDINGTLVVRGPVSIRHFVHKDEDDDEEEDGAEETDSSKADGECALGGDQCRVQVVKYSGHVTLNISGFAFIDTTDWRQGVTIVLPSESKFSVERTIPHRFQQKTIVQRQKEKFQSTEGLLALETFSHLRF